MNIALVGYGKMGKEIESVALTRNHHISLTIDVNNRHELTPESLKPCDVAIEFTSPHTAADNIRACLAAGVPVVCGSTGWLEQLEEIRRECEAQKGAFFYASNYSIGVNIFFRINEILAGMMCAIDGYRPSMEESHHTEKKDAPSGTAITLAEKMLSELKPLKKWVSGASATKDELPIVSLREPGVFGTHTVRYESDVDCITLSHAAKNRRGFALGAVLAAEFLKGKQGCYGMDDLVKF
ncbi:MAG: 4-hydroxy-tetrahydrodipicolinate reductase [Prevotellaceae bacterium]|jgi:4-hydroxy-tetrahydrodipicolinate reductase|nr:4-hydroxy-tetrahydrodipicolinate reductase [Prevotellaceae bacterium]